MDVIELPPPADTPPDTDVVDLGSGDGQPIVVPKRTTTLTDSTQRLLQCHGMCLCVCDFKFQFQFL
jgi:hypothetical protein